MDIEKTVKKLQKDTNNSSDITYRIKYINNKKIYIIYISSLVGDTKVSDFIVRSLDNIDEKYVNDIDIYPIIKNDIDSFKVKETNDYMEMWNLLSSGFTLVLIENSDNNYLLFETRRNLFRGIDMPKTENNNRGPMDCFVENIETNIGLIRRRIKEQKLWIDDNEVGKYTKTKVSVLYLENLVDKNLLNKLNETIKKIDIDKLINSGSLKNLIQKENKDIFPTILSSERPDVACESILQGKIVIIVDNSPFVLILPSVLNDFFKTSDDNYGKSINVTTTRILRYLSFFISLFTPAIYIAITNFNQEMLPTDLISSFAAQREAVPFPALIESIIMVIAFELLRESDIRKGSFASSSISIVGALILGEAAVNAGIVSPIMIIVIATTAICSLPFSEPELINGLRLYRFIFMFSAVFLGIFGVVIAFAMFLSKMTRLTSFGKPYLTPYAPTYLSGLKDSIIKLPIRKQSNTKKEEI